MNRDAVVQSLEVDYRSFMDHLTFKRGGRRKEVIRYRHVFFKPFDPFMHK